MPCTLDVGLSIIQGRNVIRTMPGIRLHDDWPAREIHELLPWYVKQLKADPALYGWGVWLMVDAATKQVIGDIGFKGKPEHGTVELGYSVVPARRRQGYAFEAASALVMWAFNHKDVHIIKAECEKDNIPSIRTLEKLRMRCLGEDGNLLKWETHKTIEGP